MKLSLHEKVDLLHSRIDQIVEVMQGFEREESRPLGELIEEGNELWIGIKMKVQDWGCDEGMPDEECIPGPAGGIGLSQNLGFHYVSQFVDNETTDKISLNLADEKPQSIFQLEYKPMLKGTLVGTLFAGDSAIYTFVSVPSGKIVLKEIGDVLWSAENIIVDWNHSIVTVQWKECHGYAVWLKVSYEYSIS